MARRGYSILFATGLFLADIIAVSLGFISAYFIRFYGYDLFFFLPPPVDIPPLFVYSKTLPLTWLITVLSFWGGGLYRESLSFRKIVRIGSIIKQVFFSVILLIVFSAFYREISFSRLFIIMLFPFFAFFVICTRMALINLEYFIRKSQKKIREIVLIGDGLTTANLMTALNTNLYPGVSARGFISFKDNNDDPLCLGSVENFHNILKKHQPDEVIISGFQATHKSLTEIMTYCDQEMIQFYIIPDILNFLTSKVELTNVGGINIIGIQMFPLDNGLNRLLKRFFDVTASLTAILLLSPLFLILPVLIKLSTPGPIFYRQTRCNEDGKKFSMLKFRTMREDAEKETGPVWAKEEDNRKTKLGSFLRALNIDELPQLINVITGDMSLVGPRPERPHFISQFKTEIPRYMSRHAVKPGITGWAQVNGWRGNTSLDERIKCDIYYIENWSFWLDLKIIFMTIFAYKNAY